MTLNKRLRVGIIGATGMVGSEFIKIFNQRKFPIDELRLFASENSKGKNIPFRDTQITLQVLEEGCFKDLDVVFISTGDDISREWSPRAVREGCIVIDNSSAFRMDPETPLVVPEVNGDLLPKSPKPCIIANPNCSTIQLVVALNPLKEKFGLKSVKVATYQAVSGAGKEAVEELKSQTLGVLNNKTTQPQVFPHSIAFNNIPQIGSFGPDGFTSEETKVMNETRKILRHDELSISAFAVRVPALNSHCEAVWVELEKTVNPDDMLSALMAAPGLEVIDHPSQSQYPMATQASGQDAVYIGRIHQDLQDPRTWLMWVVADNIRKGAALNAIQIAEHIYS